MKELTLARVVGFQSGELHHTQATLRLQEHLYIIPYTGLLFLGALKLQQGLFQCGESDHT